MLFQLQDGTKNTFENVLVTDSYFISSTTKYCFWIMWYYVTALWPVCVLGTAGNTDKAHLPEALTHHPFQNDTSLFPTQSLAGWQGVRAKGESDTSVTCHFLSNGILLFCFIWCRKNVKVTDPGTGRKSLVKTFKYEVDLKRGNPMVSTSLL